MCLNVCVCLFVFVCVCVCVFYDTRRTLQVCYGISGDGRPQGDPHPSEELDRVKSMFILGVRNTRYVDAPLMLCKQQVWTCW